MDMFERRRVDIGFLQKVSYRGQGTNVDKGEEKYKFWWSGSEEGRNGEGIMVKEDLGEEVIEVKRLNETMKKIAIVCGRKILRVFTVYALQHAGPEEEKRKFLEKRSDNKHFVPQEDLLMVAGDMSCHIGSTRDSFEHVMGCFSFGV